MTEASAAERPQRSIGQRLRDPLQRVGGAAPSLEVDTRLLGMIAALAVIWIGFNVMSDGLFLTARNLWNLSVQTSVVAVMATGMVLIIVSRNIDLSVGSILGFTGYLMAMLQAIWIPTTFGLGFDQPYTWIVSLRSEEHTSELQSLAYLV